MRGTALVSSDAGLATALEACSGSPCDGSFASWLSRMEENTDSVQMTGVSVSLSLKPTFGEKKK